METMTGPEVLRVMRHNGTAGQYAYLALIQYPGEKPETVSFVSSVYGAPVVMVSPSGWETFVDFDVVRRCGGVLDDAWVHRFFA